MLKRFAGCLLAVVISAGLLWAHGDATHIMGTVAAVEGDHLTVKTQAGKSEMIMLGKTTKYLIGTKPATVSDLKVGTRVVVDAKADAKTKMYSALEIKIGTAAAAKK